jgi:hypothetical protein
MKRISLLMFAILAMALVMACGGGEDPNETGASTGEVAVDVEVIEVALDDNGFISEVPLNAEAGEVFPINFKVGTTYEIHFTNHAVRIRVLLINRWGIEAIAKTGETTISNQFTPVAPGDYGCTEKLLGGTDPRFKCRAIVS